MKVAGYSGTPLLQKLGVKPGTRFAVVNPPKDLRETLPQVAAASMQSREADVLLLFATSARILVRELPGCIRRLAKDRAALWVAWPKKSSGRKTNLFFDVVQRAGLMEELVDTKICAISDIWSGLRFSRRRTTR